MRRAVLLCALLIGCTAYAGEFCSQKWEINGDALNRECTIAGASCQTPPFPWHWKLEVDCPGSTHDMTLRLVTATSNKCFNDAIARWICFMDYANGFRAGTDGCPRFGGSDCEGFAKR